jgi:hypothetical protein
VHRENWQFVRSHTTGFISIIGDACEETPEKKTVCKRFAKMPGINAGFFAYEMYFHYFYVRKFFDFTSLTIKLIEDDRSGEILFENCLKIFQKEEGSLERTFITN